MKTHHRLWTLAAVVTGARLLGTAKAQPPAAGAQQALPEPPVTLQKGTGLSDVVQALESGAGGVLAADVSAHPDTILKPLEDAPLSRALERISLDLDRFWVRRGRTLVLQRRYSRPGEEAGIELEEARQVAEDMGRLVAPLAPRLEGVQYTRAQLSFFTSLTPEQQQVMRSEGLPISALNREQAAAWLEINNANAYGEMARELRRAARIMELWPRVTLAETVREGPVRRQVALFYPEPRDSSGRDGIDISIPTAFVRPRVVKAEGWVLPERAVPLPASLRRRWVLGAHQTSLSAFADRFQRETGLKLETPGYAAARRFGVYSTDGTRGAVLYALADLWGWDVTPVKDGFRLGRPRPAKARDPLDLHLKLRAAVPPALQHMCRAVDEGATEWFAYQLQAATRSADEVAGADWKDVRVGQLGAEAQRHLANYTMWCQVRNALGMYLTKERPQAWNLYPERGVFRLRGSSAPGKHPLLSFTVVDPVDNRPHMWGWYIGTSSLDKN
jgi:hypothetical protein